jgi:hypothetical protein
MYEDMLEKVVLMRWCWLKSMKNSLVLMYLVVDCLSMYGMDRKSATRMGWTL